MTADHDDAEQKRLAELYSYNILDTAPEESFDRITRLVRAVLRTPIATVTFIDRDRQWFKSRQGLAMSQTARDISFCTHTIRQDVPMVVVDAADDPRFRENPLVTGEPGIRFYAGVPLRSPNGEMIGTLCAIDREPRSPTDDQVGVLQDLARMVIDELELRQLATTDSLTGAMTRRSFEHDGNNAIQRARGNGTALSCLAIDVDHFKSVNDRHGHPAGDQVLRAVVALCRRLLRPGDLLARLGGEEFAVLAPAADRDAAGAIAERLRGEIAATALPVGDPPLHITVSCGVATLRDTHANINELLQDADLALYTAKSSGRNRVVHAG